LKATKDKAEMDKGARPQVLQLRSAELQGKLEESRELQRVFPFVFQISLFYDLG
jgi:hypothetical protein